MTAVQWRENHVPSLHEDWQFCEKMREIQRLQCARLLEWKSLTSWITNFPLVLHKWLVKEGTSTNYSQCWKAFSWARYSSQAAFIVYEHCVLYYSSQSFMIGFGGKQIFKDNLCWWQMRWKTKGKNHLRVLIHNSALHLSLLSPSFLHSTSPLMD